MSDTKQISCSFCGKDQKEVRTLINGQDPASGTEVYICNDCVVLCYGIVKDSDVPKKKGKGVPSPKEINNFLDKYVIGQDYAKRVLSVAVHNHYKRLNDPVIDEVEMEKSNVLFLGPTGVGKTLLAKSISRMLDVPFTIADATTLTEAGYVGEDVESIIVRLLQAAEGDVEKTQRGIVYIDEVDKIARRGDSASITRDVSGEGVQQGLLKILEGTVCRVPPDGGRKHPNQELVAVDTTNILFILGGAFVGLEKIIDKRINKGSSIGFGADIVNREDAEAKKNELLSQVKPEDMHSFGLLPELIGRIPVRAPLRELSGEEMVHVLTEPKNAIAKQFQKLFELEGVELEFTTEALEKIADICLREKTGARGLRSVVEGKLLDVQYDLPDLVKQGLEKVVVTVDFINDDADLMMVWKSPTEVKISKDDDSSA